MDTRCDDPNTLVLKTLALVRKEPRGLLAVAQKTNVPFYWLRKFANGSIRKPSANRVQYLYEKLSGKSLLPK